MYEKFIPKRLLKSSYDTKLYKWDNDAEDGESIASSRETESGYAMGKFYKLEE